MFSRINKKQVLPGVVVFLAIAFSQVSNATEMDDLRLLLQQQAAQIDALTQRVDALTHRVQANGITANTADETARRAVVNTDGMAQSAASDDRIKWTGDFRYRYENIDDARKSKDRNRHRLRARAALNAELTDDLHVVMGLATGSDDPVSTNQTLGSGGSTKGINLDLAYFDWTVRPGFRVIGGKFKTILHRAGKSGLLWDGDWNPEGVGLRYDSERFFATATGTWLESDSARDDTEFSIGFQGGIKTRIGDSKVTAGVGYYNIGTAGKGSFFGADNKFSGNSFDPVTNTYLFDYNEIEGFIDLGFEAMGQPLSIFADYVKNTDAGEFDTGFAAGIKLGAAKKQGTWQLAYTYQDLEADAVLGLVTDSDFAGGGTDGKGHILKAAYALNDRTAFKFTYSFAEKGENANGTGTDFDRMQLDVQFKY